MRFSDKYRPRRLDDVVGQPAVRHLKNLAASPYSCCLLLECSTGGVGKTSTALALAAELGCVDDFSGLHVCPCSEFGVDDARRLFVGNGSAATLRLRPWQGSGWHVLILEEFDWLPAQTQRFLKVALETELPSKCIVIATSNGAARIDAPLLQRFRVFGYSDGPSFEKACEQRLREIWAIEAPDLPVPGNLAMFGLTTAGFSMRVALDRMQQTIVDRTCQVVA